MTTSLKCNPIIKIGKRWVGGSVALQEYVTLLLKMFAIFCAPLLYTSLLLFHSYSWSRTIWLKSDPCFSIVAVCRFSIRSLFFCSDNWKTRRMIEDLILIRLLPKQSFGHQCIWFWRTTRTSNALAQCYPHLTLYFETIVLVFPVISHNAIEFNHINSALCIHVRATRPRISSVTCKQQAATPPTTNHPYQLFASYINYDKIHWNLSIGSMIK